jgi:GNAT superfamily N-acetyltransferase
MIHLEVERNHFIISTDKAKLDIPFIHQWLSQRSYWAQGRSVPAVQQSIEHSLCFGVYAGQQQVGFARVVTDYTTFAWLADVFIVETHQGQGLGKWLIETITAQPLLRDLRLFFLGTRDAHGLYRHYGFEPLSTPERWMARVKLSA